MIVIDNLTKQYRGGKEKALRGISLQIKDGEFFGLLGPGMKVPGATRFFM